jgi:hypothetical protein
MTPAENMQLWITDRPAWIAEAAPRCAAYLASGREAVLHGWPILARDYQLAVWPLLDEATKDTIRQTRSDICATP